MDKGTVEFTWHRPSERLPDENDEVLFILQNLNSLCADRDFLPVIHDGIYSGGEFSDFDATCERPCYVLCWAYKRHILPHRGF